MYDIFDFSKWLPSVFIAAVIIWFIISLNRALAAVVKALEADSKKKHAELLDYIDKLDSKQFRKLEQILLNQSGETPGRKRYLLLRSKAYHDFELESRRVDRKMDLEWEKKEELHDYNQKELIENLELAEELLKHEG